MHREVKVLVEGDTWIHAQNAELYPHDDLLTIMDKDRGIEYNIFWLNIDVIEFL